MLAYKEKPLEVNDLSLGFDINFLFAAMEKLRCNETLCDIERGALEGARGFLDLVLLYCNGQNKSVDGLSGLEAYSTYVSSLSLEGTLDEINDEITSNLDLLNSLQKGDEVSKKDVDLLKGKFQKLFMNKLSTIENENYYWRI